MFPKKILFLVGGYIAGNVVHAIYSKKQCKVKKMQKKEDVQTLAKNFLMTQKEFLNDIEGKILSEKNKETLQEKKEKFHNFAKKYISEGEKIFSELQQSIEYKNIKTQGASFFSRLSTDVSTFWKSIKEKTFDIQSSEDASLQDVHTSQTETTQTSQKSSLVPSRKATKK